MTAEVPYSYGILRYFHDIASGECVNIGVALFSPRRNFLGLMCTYSADRAALLWPDMDQSAFKRAMVALEQSFASLGSQLPSSPKLSDLTITELVKRVLPGDDSSLKWGSFGSGLSSDPSRELSRLFTRMVRRYEPSPTRNFVSSPFPGSMPTLGLPTPTMHISSPWGFYGGGHIVGKEELVSGYGQLDVASFFDPVSQSANVFAPGSQVSIVMAQFPQSAPSVTVSTTASGTFVTGPTGLPNLSGSTTMPVTTVPDRGANK